MQLELIQLSSKKSYVKVLNAIGFYSTKWTRLPSNEKTIKPQSRVLSERTNIAIKEILLKAHFRRITENSKMGTGGSTKGFVNKRDLEN